MVPIPVRLHRKETLQISNCGLRICRTEPVQIRMPAMTYIKERPLNARFTHDLRVGTSKGHGGEVDRGAGEMGNRGAGESCGRPAATPRP